MYEAELYPRQYHTVINEEDDEIRITFYPISLLELDQEIKVNEVEATAKAEEHGKKRSPFTKIFDLIQLLRVNITSMMRWLICHLSLI